jgi:hypothetical protein
VSPKARAEISAVLQDARDNAAIARARLNAHTGIEVVRTRAVSAAGSNMAKAQSKAARVLAGARASLESTAQTDDGQHAALTAVAAPVWDLPAFTPLSELRPAQGAVRVERIASGDGAGEGTAEIAAQVSGPFAAAGSPAPAGAQLELPQELVGAVTAGARVPVSTAAAVRALMAQGETDPAEITRRVPELTGRPITSGTPATVARVIRETRAAQKSTAPAPSPYL